LTKDSDAFVMQWLNIVFELVHITLVPTLYNHMSCIIFVQQLTCHIYMMFSILLVLPVLTFIMQIFVNCFTVLLCTNDVAMHSKQCQFCSTIVIMNCVYYYYFYYYYY